MNRRRSILQSKITLLETEPPIWRRILIPATDSFWDLHVAVQDAMGWQDVHLHAFRCKYDAPLSDYIGLPDPMHDDLKVALSWDVKVTEVFDTPGECMAHQYDFGDNWRHEIELEGVLIRDKGVKYPQCKGSEHACPPEDCGGGWEHKLTLEEIRPLSNADGTPAEGMIPVCIDGSHRCPPEDIGGDFGV